MKAQTNPHRSFSEACRFSVTYLRRGALPTGRSTIKRGRAQHDAGRSSSMIQNRRRIASFRRRKSSDSSGPARDSRPGWHF